MICPYCKKEMEPTDTTYSNHNSGRAENGQHTGDIFTCDDCELHMIDDYLNEVVREFHY